MTIITQGIFSKKSMRALIGISISTFTTIALVACSPAPTPAPVQTTNQTTVFAIKLDDNGASPNSIQTGCGDSTMPVAETASYQFDGTDPIASINAALITLFSTTANQYQSQNLVNPLANQTMMIQSVTASGNNYTTHLTGSFAFGGVCEMPRVRAQVEETIRKAALTGNTFDIDWNGGGQTAWNAAFSQQ